MIVVVDWISPEAAEPLAESFGGLGGWFGFPTRDSEHPAHTWADYLERICGDSSLLRERAEALRASILERRIWEDGGWHQHDDHGVPRFDDDTIASFSLRAWGDLLAAVWTTRLGRPYCYMDFYYGGTATKPDDFEARAAAGGDR
jgi:hypothetical protein